MNYLLTISELDLGLILESLRLLSMQRLFGADAERAGILAEELEEWKERQDGGAAA